MTKETNSDLIQGLHLRASLNCICRRPVERAHHPSCPAPFFLATIGRTEALSEALKPFAEAADNLTGDEPDQGSLWESPEAMMLEYRHLRNARTTLQQTKSPSEVLPDDEG